jgi:hypothetical protein
MTPGEITAGNFIHRLPLHATVELFADAATLHVATTDLTVESANAASAVQKKWATAITNLPDTIANAKPYQRQDFFVQLVTVSATGLSLAPVGEAEVLMVFRGTTRGAALETVQGQAFDVVRIEQLQTLTGQARQGVYVSSQKSTADFFADIAGGNGRGLGPAVVRIEVPAKEFQALAKKYGITVESPVSRLPGMTETLLPFESIEEFEAFAEFFHH